MFLSHRTFLEMIDEDLLLQRREITKVWKLHVLQWSIRWRCNRSTICYCLSDSHHHTRSSLFNTPTASVYSLHPSMVSRVVSLFRFRSRCLIRISVVPFALRRLIRPFAALPLLHGTPRSLPRVCVRRQGQHRLYHYALHSQALYVSLVSESVSLFPPSCALRRQATLPSVRSRRHTLVHPSFTLRTARI
jgi:hypothetical protein